MQTRLVRNFIEQRMRAILKSHIPISIEPTDLINNLDIDLHSIYVIFEHNVTNYKQDIGFYDTVRKINLNEFLDESENTRYKLSHGHSILRYERKCDLCKKNLMDPRAFC